MTSDPEILFEDERYTVYRNGLVVDNSTGNADNGVAGEPKELTNRQK